MRKAEIIEALKTELTAEIKIVNNTYRKKDLRENSFHYGRTNGLFYALYLYGLNAECLERLSKDRTLHSFVDVSLNDETFFLEK